MVNKKIIPTQSNKRNCRMNENNTEMQTNDDYRGKKAYVY